MGAAAKICSTLGATGRGIRNMSLERNTQSDNNSCYRDADSE